MSRSWKPGGRNFPGLAIDLVPVGDVLYELANQIDEGKFKGLDDITGIYTDGVHFDDGGKLGNIGSYAVALTFYATIFKKSPVGDKEFGLWGISDPELAKQIQTLVWEVVAGPLSGVPGPVRSHQRLGLPFFRDDELRAWDEEHGKRLPWLQHRGIRARLRLL